MCKENENWHRSLNLILECEDSEEMQLDSLHGLIGSILHRQDEVTEEVIDAATLILREDRNWENPHFLERLRKALATYQMAKGGASHDR